MDRGTIEQYCSDIYKIIEPVERRALLVRLVNNIATEELPSTIEILNTMNIEILDKNEIPGGHELRQAVMAAKPLRDLGMMLEVE